MIKNLPVGRRLVACLLLMGQAPSSLASSSERPAEEQAQLDDLIAYVRQLPSVGSSRLCSSGSASDPPAAPPAAVYAPPDGSHCWSRAPAFGPRHAIGMLSGDLAQRAATPSGQTASALLPGSPCTKLASAPIPIVRLSEWSSRDIDLASRELEFSHMAAGNHPIGLLSTESPPSRPRRLPEPRTREARASFEIVIASAASRRSGRSSALDGSSAHGSSSARGWSFPRSAPSGSRGSSSLRHSTPPPAPRCKPSAAPVAMLPRLELPPPSPANTSLSSSPLSSTGVSLISSTPPESRVVQVGFYVGFQVSGEEASATHREVSSAAALRYGTRVRSS